jgi:tRNA threonylcarbamoyladenosine biosynthesis protein TsaE
VRVELQTVDDTRAFGRRLAGILRAGDLVVLHGPLGAGKTALAQGVGAGLAVRGEVTSPTFVIARVHRTDPARGGTIPLVHVDAYRLDSMSDVDDLDLDADVTESVTVVEWGAGKVEQLSDARLEVHLQRRDDDTRLVELVGAGGDWQERLERLEQLERSEQLERGVSR